MSASAILHHSAMNRGPRGRAAHSVIDLRAGVSEKQRKSDRYAQCLCPLEMRKLPKVAMRGPQFTHASELSSVARPPHAGLESNWPPARPQAESAHCL